MASARAFREMVASPMLDFAHVEDWVFDLDNTLYPASCRLFDQVDERMGQFISAFLKIDRAEAKRVQKQYFHQHGTTLRGLMLEHNMNPDEFLDYVHDIDHSPVPADPALAAALEALPGRKVIFTNGTVTHAQNILRKLGCADHFEDIFDIVHSDYLPKPQLAPYQKFIAQTGIRPEKAAMFEDIARNLEVPASLGMKTILVTSSDNEDGNLINQLSGGIEQPHVHYQTPHLAGFLEAIVKARQAS